MLERVFGLDLTTWWAKKQIKKRKLKKIWDIIQWNEEADVFIMGHTHNPEVLIWVDKNENIKTYVIKVYKNLFHVFCIKNIPCYIKTIF